MEPCNKVNKPLIHYYYVTPLTLDDHPTTTTVTVTDTDMGEGSGTSNLRLSITVLPVYPCSIDISLQQLAPIVVL